MVNIVFILIFQICEMCANALDNNGLLWGSAHWKSPSAMGLAQDHLYC